MPTVRELTGLYENFMFPPRRGPGVCAVCFNLTDGYERCYRCVHGRQILDAVVPISYSVAGEQLHHALACYKRRSGQVARRLGVELAGVLWRFLDEHEHCLAEAASTPAFTLVTTVPSGHRDRDEGHPLRRIVGELVGPTRERYEPLLVRSALEVEPRTFHPAKYATLRQLDGESVLLVDDTWTTGANAQSAAAALKASGAVGVAAAVIGRHVNRGWHQNDGRLKALNRFDWSRCALCDRVSQLAPG